MTRAYLDTNVLVYAFTSDPKRERAQQLLQRGGTISVQTLNEFANVALRKLRRDWDEVGVALAVIRSHFPDVVPIDLATHALGLALGRRNRLSIYDAMHVAAARRAGCDILYSEDMHHGLVIDGQLRVVNPFV